MAGLRLTSSATRFRPHVVLHMHIPLTLVAYLLLCRAPMLFPVVCMCHLVWSTLRCDEHAYQQV